MVEVLTNSLTLAQTTAAEQPESTSGWVMLLVLAGVFVVPFALGTLIGQALKLKDLSFKIGVVLFTVVLGLTPFAWHIGQGLSQGKSVTESLQGAIRLGIDLAGGTNLVFQVEELPDKPITSEVMDQMVAAVSRRINPSGTEEVVVRQVGRDRLEVIIPGADPEVVRQKKSLMTRLGSLEFAILANRRDHSDIIRLAQDADRDVRREDGRVVARWVPVGTDEKGAPKQVEEHGEVVTRPIRRDGEVVTGPNGQPLKEFLVILEPEDQRVTGKYLTSVSQGMDENGAPAVSFQFNSRGARLFFLLTSDNQPSRDGFKRRLAILLDGKVHSAPNINEPIPGGRGQISGRFSQAELQELINVLNAGALEVPINPNPISEQSTSPLLGHDVQVKGVRAILIASVCVLGFMAVYYLFAGMVADLCLVMTLILVMGVMALIDATFTLPGLAGIVLTIGMAVDANVLIFERIREEQNRGSSVRMAIHNGFGRALSAIVDANVTTLITAVVLYMIGTDQVRGFAVTLFIGIVMSMYSALYFGRLMFDIWERKRWLKQVKMLSLVGVTRWDFLSKWSIAAMGSMVLIVSGMSALYARGQENLDIDFSGGTMVTFEFVEPQRIEEVRTILEDVPELGQNITLERLLLVGEEPSASGVGKRFRLRTKEQDVDKVRQAINEALTETGHELRRVTVELGSIEKVASQADGSKETPDASSNDNSSDQANPSTENGSDDEFAGGRRVELTFSDEISPATVQRYLVDSILEIPADETVAESDVQPKYDEPGSLFELTGTVGSGMTAAEGEVRRYSKMVLNAAPALDRVDLQTALHDMQSTMAANPVFDEVTSFDSRVAAEMQQSALMAILASLVAIVAYIWFRFQRVTFGLAAVVAVVHDVLVVVGLVALGSYLAETPVGTVLLLSDFKINLPMIAAFLTIVGYSLNDTIVVFDRIREVRGKNPALTREMVNRSLNQTLARTILTSLTTLLVVAILYVFGGEGIHGFAYCLVAGVIVGTYSSMYVASPVLLWLMNRPGAASATARSQPARASA